MIKTAYVEEIQKILGIQVKTTVRNIIDNAGRDTERKLKEIDHIGDNEAALAAALKVRTGFILDTLFDVQNHVKVAAEEIIVVLKDKNQLDEETAGNIKVTLEHMIEATK